jgi:hypothetical protein
VAERGGGYLRSLTSAPGAGRPATPGAAASSHTTARAPHRPAWGPATGDRTPDPDGSGDADPFGGIGAPADVTAAPTARRGAGSVTAPPLQQPDRDFTPAPRSAPESEPTAQSPAVPPSVPRPDADRGPLGARVRPRGLASAGAADRTGAMTTVADPAADTPTRRAETRPAQPEASPVRAARRATPEAVTRAATSPAATSPRPPAALPEPGDTRENADAPAPRRTAARARLDDLRHLAPQPVSPPRAPQPPSQPHGSQPASQPRTARPATVRVVLPDRPAVPAVPAPEPAAPAVHIGVVEVRVEAPRPVLPTPPHQPAAPQPAAQPHHGRARLSRLAPHFGLGQG